MDPDEVVGVEDISASLAAAIDAAAAAFTIQETGAGFPAASFQVKIDNEVILVGSRSGAVFSSLTRGQEGTVAVPHAANTRVDYVVGGEALAEVTNADGLPTGWTEDDSDPAFVQGGAGGLDFDDGTNDAGISAGVVAVGSEAGEAYNMRLGNGITSASTVSVPCFSAYDTAGATVALDAGGLPVVNLPAADPGIPGALWNNAGTPAISAG